MKVVQGGRLVKIVRANFDDTPFIDFIVDDTVCTDVKGSEYVHVHVGTIDSTLAA